MEASPSRTGTSARLLVVDDEPAVRDVLADALDEAGYQVTVAADAREAFGHVKEGGIQLVLSDVDMPEHSGLELLKWVKAHNPDIDVVMVTGVVDTETAVAAIRDGASDYVTKPFNLDEVQIVVERTLEKRRLVQENRAYQQHLEAKVVERTRELLEKKQEIEHLYEDLRESYESTLLALITALDIRDNETQGHSGRVVEYATLVARTMGIDGEDLEAIRRGAILHDVGKIGIRDAVLRKPGKLTEDEWEEMRRHPELGFQMLRHIRFLQPSLDIVLHHQERWDGSGYPHGLKGEEIPLGARIFAVVDTFDAMTSDRPYRSALSIEEAVEEIRRFAGTQFDPEVAEAFLSIPIETWREIRRRVHEETEDLDQRARRALS